MLLSFLITLNINLEKTQTLDHKNIQTSHYMREKVVYLSFHS